MTHQQGEILFFFGALLFMSEKIATIAKQYGNNDTVCQHIFYQLLLLFCQTQKGLI